MSTINVNRMVDSQGGVLAPSSSVMRNRIINGAMTIDQRNAGASVTVTGLNYALDRWFGEGSQSSKFTIQQNAGAVTPPAGFSNYLGCTSSAATSLGSTDYFILSQRIEGFNFADLGWGTANAKTVTLSFQVYSSLTGTFGGAFLNNANNRSYPFSYSIPVANTWTTISITIAGDTTGTWVGATNGTGLKVIFSLGSGSTYSGTAGSWAGSLLLSAAGATSVVGTNGATFYITGVQLEKGTQATSFEYRQYGQELTLCQRYYYKIKPALNVPLGTSAFSAAATTAYSLNVFSQSMRTAPTALEQTGTAGNYGVFMGGTATTCSAVPTFAYASTDTALTIFTVASGLAVGQGGYARPVGAGAADAYLAWSAEL